MLIKNIFNRLKALYKLHPRRFLVIGIVFIIFVLIITKKPDPLVTEVVEEGTLRETVLATGKVVSTTDLSLSFPVSDIVRSIRVSVGDIVKKDTILATLDNRDELANVTKARGALQLAKANYQKVIDGASSEEIDVAEVALKNAENDLEVVKITQDNLVSNAYRALLNSTITAVPSSSNIASGSTPLITGVYNLEKEGVISISTYNTSSGLYFSASGLIEAGGPATANSTPIPLNNSGLFISFPSGFSNQTIGWTINIPNTQASDYITNLNAYSAAKNTRDGVVLSAEAVVNSRRADLALKKALARPAEISAAEADVISAEGQLSAVSVAYENTILRAPADGTIVSIDTKIGEQPAALSEVMVLQDVSNLYLESDINETNISKIVLGQRVDATLDAFGPEEILTTSVSQVDPSATTVSGIVNYQIQAKIENNPLVRPGMTANITILISEKPDVLMIPKRSVFTNKDGAQAVSVVTNEKRRKTEERVVTLGARGDGDMVEVVSGLSAGETILALPETK